MTNLPNASTPNNAISLIGLTADEAIAATPSSPPRTATEILAACRAAADAIDRMLPLHIHLNQQMCRAAHDGSDFAPSAWAELHHDIGDQIKAAWMAAEADGDLDAAREHLVVAILDLIAQLQVTGVVTDAALQTFNQVPQL